MTKNKYLKEKIIISDINLSKEEKENLINNLYKLVNILFNEFI